MVFTVEVVVEWRDIEIFLTLAEELHFGRTAERLHVSTARVSQTIRKLERRIGAALFDRTSRQVALTLIGRRLEADLRPAYQQIREGIDRAIAAAAESRACYESASSARPWASSFTRRPESSLPGIPPARSRSRKPATVTSSNCFAPTRSASCSSLCRWKSPILPRVQSYSASRPWWPFRPGTGSPGAPQSRWRI
jgi:hypothetical protein